jgi:phosphate uptake regulator
MQRKLVQIGQHTLMAAIPSSWVKKHGLRKGDLVEFTEFENKLVVTANAEVYERKSSIHIPSPKIEIVWRMLQPTYTSGYDEVHITFDDPKVLTKIEESMPQLIGFEIVEVKEDSITIKSISAQLDEELPVVLVRAWNVALTMMTTYRESMSKRSRLPEIHTLEFTMNKYTMFLKRVMNRTGYKYPQYTYQIVSFLELATNHLDYLRRYFLAHPKIKLEQEAFREAERLQGLLQRTYKLYAGYTEEEFRWIAEEQPHFAWFTKIKDPVIRMNYTAMAEYLVQIARQIQALHT